jgi:hypothetical protein
VAAAAQAQALMAVPQAVQAVVPIKRQSMLRLRRRQRTQAAVVLAHSEVLPPTAAQAAVAS